MDDDASRDGMIAALLSRIHVLNSEIAALTWRQVRVTQMLHDPASCEALARLPPELRHRMIFAMTGVWFGEGGPPHPVDWDQPPASWVLN